MYYSNDIKHFRVLKLLMLTVLFCIFFMGTARAQYTCSKRLEQATEADVNGQFSRCLWLLEPCLKNGEFSWEESWKALRLKARALVNQQRWNEAEQVVRALFKAYPDFKPDEELDGPILPLLDQFYVEPLAAVGFHAGWNISRVEVLKSFETIQVIPNDSIETKLEDQYVDQQGFSAGISGMIRILPRVSLGLGFSYTRKSLRRILELESILPSVKKEYEDKLDFLEVPVFFHVDILRSRLSPFVEGGFNFSLLRESKYTLKDEDAGKVFDYGSSSLSFRAKTDFRVFATLGVSYRFRMHRLLFTARFDPGNRALNHPDNYGHISEFGLNGHVSDILRLHSLGLHLGYQFVWMKVVQKAKYRKGELL